MEKKFEFWFWTITDPFTGRRRQLSYRMTERTARERFGKDAVKVEGAPKLNQPQAGTTSSATDLGQPGQ